MTILTTAINFTQAHHGAESWFDEYLTLLVDPAHILFELTFTLVFDFLVIFLGYRLIVKKFIIPKLRHEIHREIDEEHHVLHHHHLPGETAAECAARLRREELNEK